MRRLAAPAILALTVLAFPAGAAAQADRTAGPPARGHPAQVEVTARIVVVDREALARAGLDYVVLGNNRVRVRAAGNRGGGARDGGGGVVVGTHRVKAFLDLARENRWVRSESTQRVLTMSGGEGMISSTGLSIRRGAARTRGPSLVVSPTVLDDGAVHLRVSTGVEDRVTYPWGYGVDGSPAAVETEIIARDGQEVILASSSSATDTRQAGLLGWGRTERERAVLVAVTTRVVR
ncbi:MAG TPA: hypothetical protein VK966_02830 [Longimicrobiales bacterium]|nr:hypothetical protein [Longimicrobiales bacterium]